MNNLIPLRDFTAERIPADAIIAKNVFSDLEAINPLAERSVMGSTTSPTFDPDIEKANQRAKSVQEPLYDFSLAENIRYQGGSEFSRLTPTADLEREYSMLKGGRWARKFSEFRDNFDYAFAGNYESMGASINAAEDELVGMNFDKIWEAISTDNITDSAYKKTQRDRIREVTQPFYKYYAQGEAPIYSPEGMLGDLVPSIGFAAGGGAAMATDMIGAGIIKASIATGVGAIAVAALYGVGAPALTNDWLRDKIGERAADIMLGYLTSAGATAILGGIGNGALKSGAKGLKEIKDAATVANKESANIYKAIVESTNNIAGMGDDIIKGGSSASTQMGKAFDVLKGKAATLNKKTIGTQIAGHLALGYLTSGGEAAMEATNAQADYIDERYNEIVQGENRIPTEQELADIKEESKGVLGSVNKWNRAILTVSNAIGMRGLLSDPLRNNFIKQIPFIFGEDVTGGFSTKKELFKYAKNWLVDAGKEAAEEMSQFGITEGAKEYYEKELEKRDNIDALVDGLLGAVSSEGLYEGLLGGLTGGGMTVFRAGSQVITKNKEDSWQKALFGYDNESVNKVAENLQKQLMSLKGIFDVSNTKDMKDTNNQKLQQDIHDKSFNLLYSLYESGQGSKMGLILDNLSQSMSEEQIKNIYGGNKDSVTGKSVSQLSPEETQAYFRGVVKKYDKEAKQLATDIFNIGEYFVDPFSLSTMEKLADNSFMTKLFKDKKSRELGYDITDTYKETAFKKKQLNVFAKDQVKIAARRMFMARMYKQDFDSSLEQLKAYEEKHKDTNLFQKITIDGKTQSLLDFVTPHQWGTDEFNTMIDDRIKALETTAKVTETVGNKVASEGLAEMDNEQATKEKEELEGLRSLKSRVTKHGSLENMLFKEAISMFELDSLDDDLAAEFRRYEEDLNRDEKEIRDNDKVFKNLPIAFKNRGNASNVTKAFLERKIGKPFDQITKEEIGNVLEEVTIIDQLGVDTLLEVKRKLYEDRKEEARKLYEDNGIYGRKPEDPKSPKALKRLEEFENSILRANTVLLGLSNIKNFKQSLIVTEQFEQKKNDPSYKKQYLVNMFEIYDKHTKKKDDNNTNKVNATKGVDKYIQPGDGSRESLKRYTISERGIFYKNDKGEEVPISTSPTDFTKLKNHIEGTDAEGLKAFTEFEKDQKKIRDEKITKLQEEIKNLESQEEISITKTIKKNKLSTDKLPDYVKEQIERDVETADRLGITDQILQLSFESLVAAQVVSKIKDLSNDVIDGETGRDIVRSVRTYYQIPSQNDATEFKTWQEEIAKETVFPESTEPNPLAILLKQEAIETAKKEYDEAIEEYKKDNDVSSKVTTMLDDFKAFEKEVNESKLNSVPLQESEIGGLRDMGLSNETLTYISMFKESGLLTVEC